MRTLTSSLRADLFLLWIGAQVLQRSLDVSLTFIIIAPWFMPCRSSARKGTQYLALAPLPSLNYRTTFHGSTHCPSCIQIWSISPTRAPDKSQDMEVACLLVACIDDGPVKDLKWAPLPSHDDTRTQDSLCLMSPDDHCMAQPAKVLGSLEFLAQSPTQGGFFYTSFPTQVAF